MFTCRVTFPHWLQWRVHFFDGSLSEPDVLQSYVPSGPVGDFKLNHRNGFNFAFNLTSNSSLSLVSTMTVTVDVNFDSSISGVRVNCDQGADSYNERVVHIHYGNE